MERILTLIFDGLLVPGLGFDHHSKAVKKFGAFCWLSVAIYMHIIRASYLIICMKLGHGELSLISFLVRCIAPLICNMMYVCEEKKRNILQIVCRPFRMAML